MMELIEEEEVRLGGRAIPLIITTFHEPQRSGVRRRTFFNGPVKISWGINDIPIKLINSGLNMDYDFKAFWSSSVQMDG